MDTGATLTFRTAATDTNSGTIAVDGTLDVKAATTLSGTGTLTLTDGAITGLSGRDPRSPTRAPFKVRAPFRTWALPTSGTLSANQSAALVILPTAAGLNNTGTINVAPATPCRSARRPAGALTNFSGTTLTGGIYNVTGTLQFGASGTTIATNAANITLTGTGEMIDFGSNNILAGFNNNSSTGSLQAGFRRVADHHRRQFHQRGHVHGSDGHHVYGRRQWLQLHADRRHARTVNGTLTSSTLGTLAVNGGIADRQRHAGLQRGGCQHPEPGRFGGQDRQTDGGRHLYAETRRGRWTSRSTAPPRAPSTINSK